MPRHFCCAITGVSYGASDGSLFPLAINRAAPSSEAFMAQIIALVGLRLLLFARGGFGHFF